MGELSLLDYIIYTLLPFGQLFARVNNYNASLDYWWFLLIPFFNLPIIGVIPLLLMNYIKINDGYIKTPIFDKFILLPLIIKLYSPYIFPYIFRMSPNSIAYLMITFFIQVIVGIAANIARRNRMCSEKITASGLIKTMMDATISHNMGELFIFIFYFIYPTYDKSNIYDFILWSCGFSLTYIINNMYNENYSQQYCSTPIFGYAKDMFIFLGSVFILILTKYNTKFTNTSISLYQNKYY